MISDIWSQTQLQFCSLKSRGELGNREQTNNPLNHDDCVIWDGSVIKSMAMCDKGGNFSVDKSCATVIWAHDNYVDCETYTICFKESVVTSGIRCVPM